MAPGPDSHRFGGTYPAIPLGVAAIRDEMGAVARECGLPEQAVGDVRLAVSEAVTNAIVHAYAEKEGDVRVDAYVDDGELMIVVADQGPGVRPRPDSPGLGLGLPMIATLCRRFEIVSTDHGTEVHMVFGRPAPSAG